MRWWRLGVGTSSILMFTDPNSDCHKCNQFQPKFRVFDEMRVDFRIWIADFGFKVFCLFY